jgi:hypothetical protein
MPSEAGAGGDGASAKSFSMPDAVIARDNAVRVVALDDPVALLASRVGAPTFEAPRHGPRGFTRRLLRSQVAARRGVGAFGVKDERLDAEAVDLGVDAADE